MNLDLDLENLAGTSKRQCLLQARCGGLSDGCASAASPSFKVLVARDRQQAAGYCYWRRIGSLWVLFSLILGMLGGHFFEILRSVGALGHPLGRSWGSFGGPWGSFGGCWGPLGGPWVLLGRFGGHVGLI